MPLRAGAFHCTGAERKMNWLLVRALPEAQRCIVFFPGDISDFAPLAGLPYSYSLEALMWVLCSKFPGDTIVLVKPRMMVDHYAIYVNFMLVDSTGNPRPLGSMRRSDERAGGAAEDCDERMPDASTEEVIEPPHAVAHLQGLLSSLETELGAALPPQLMLVGFSKGAVVLAALLREAQAEPEFWGRVRAVHFVDAGLSVPGVFPLREEELQAASLVAPEGFAIWLHGTPRQWEDAARPFVAEETDAFARRCETAGLRVERRCYGAGEAPSLDMHFDSLRCFCTGGAEDAEASGERHLGFFRAWSELGGA